MVLMRLGGTGMPCSVSSGKCHTAPHRVNEARRAEAALRMSAELNWAALRVGRRGWVIDHAPINSSDVGRSATGMWWSIDAVGQGLSGRTGECRWVMGDAH